MFEMTNYKTDTFLEAEKSKLFTVFPDFFGI
jgi:hypothetical protein